MANQVLYTLGTPITFQDSGGTVTMTLQNMAPGVGRISPRYDRGTGAKAGWHEVRGIFQFETAPIIGEGVEIYIAQSDGTYADGVVGTIDAALTTGQMLNLGTAAVVVKAQTVNVATDNIASETIFIASRYFSVGVYNRSAGDNLENTANASRVIVTPYVAEVQ